MNMRDRKLKGWPRTMWRSCLEGVGRLAARKRSAGVAHPDSAPWLRGWMVLVVLLGTMAYAIAEEITLTTYYPSPRGVYKELRVGSGSVSTPTATLHVVKTTIDGKYALRVDNEPSGAKRFTVDENGNVHASALVEIGNPSTGLPPSPVMLVITQANPNQAAFVLSKQGVPGWSLIGVPNVGVDGGYNPVSRAGDVGLFFNDGIAQDTGNLAIGPWSNTAAGMRITKEGNVGIGVSDPLGRRLNVFHPTGEAIWAGSLSGTALRASSDFGTAITASANTGNAITATVTTPPGTGTAVWAGNFGVGNTAYFQQVGTGNALVVDARVGSGIIARVTTAPNTAAAVWGINGEIDADSYAGYFQGRVRVDKDPSDSTVPFVIQNGKVGIRNPNPVKELDVTGDGHFTGTATCDSDARLKTHVVPLTDILTKLEQIRGVSFEWNALATSRGHAPGERGVGVIGQELEAAFPELVSALGPEQYRAVDYGKLSVVLLEALKELKHEHEALQQKHDTVTQRLAAAEQRVAELAGQQAQIEELQAGNNALKARVEALER